MSEINLEEKLCKNLEDSCIKAYKAGQQSMQAIIDDLIYKAKLRESDHQALLVKYQATKKCWEDMGKECESLKAQLNNMEACYIQVKKEEVEDQQKRIDGALFEMRQLSLMLSKDIDGYEDPAQICQSEGVDMGVRILEKALRGEHENSN